MPSDSSSIKPVVQGRRIPRFVSVVACGFCQGAGVDPSSVNTKRARQSMRA